MKVILIKNLNGLFMPAYDSDKEICNKIKVGEAVEVDFKKKRNYKFHKKFFALLNLAYSNSDYEMSFDEFRKEVIRRAGFYREVVNFIGVTEYYAKSISFAKMDELEFSELYSKSLDVILKYILKENTKEEIEQEIINFI